MDLKEEEIQKPNKNKFISKYHNEGIFLIFNKLTTEYNLFIHGISNDLNSKKNRKRRKALFIK